MDDSRPGGYIGFFVSMVFLWKWLHRKIIIETKPGLRIRTEDCEIKVTEGGFEDSKELEDKLP